MKYFELFNDSGFHTTIATSFCVDFAAYEGVVLSRLREAGSMNNVLIVDERMLAQAMGDEESLPQHAGRRYSVLGSRAQGVFHPKLVLQLGKTEARLVVASANLTASGIGGNLEVMGQVRVSDADSTLAPVVRYATDYLATILRGNGVAKKQFDWAFARCTWLERTAPAESVSLPDGRRIGVLLNSGNDTVGRRFTALVGRRRVQRLIIASPYWDEDLSATKRLAAALNAPEVCLVISPQSGLFPKHRLSEPWDVFDISHVGDWAKGRFAHGKVVIAETADSDCVLYGSSNCTEAALGLQSTPAVNEEASLYRELPPGRAVEYLKLGGALTKAARVRVTDIPSFNPGETIPLEELSQHLPGTFVLSARTVTWSVPAGLRGDGYRIEFCGNDGRRLELGATAAGADGDDRHFMLDGDVEPHFARVVGPGFRSSLAVVLVQHAISVNQRGVTSKPVRDALEFFDDEEACEGTWILEVIQTLSRHERTDGGDRRTRAPNDVQRANEHKTLSYEEFIRGREKVALLRAGASSLAASHMDSVRAFLNFLVGHGSKATGEVPDPAASAPNLGLGDETDSPEDSLEEGSELNERVSRSSDDAEAKRLAKVRRYQQYVKDTQSTVVSAVSSFLERARERADSEPLSSVDVLRLRALLMVVLSSGTSATQVLQTDIGNGLRRQVLPSRGDITWQLLVGRLLFAFFRRHEGNAAPLVFSLKLDLTSDSGLPVDILETWATCLWAACACLVATDHKGAAVPPSPRQVSLVEDVYATLGLPAETLDSPSVMEIFEGLARRYGARLGVDRSKAEQVHRSRGRVGSSSTPHMPVRGQSGAR